MLCNIIVFEKKNQPCLIYLFLKRNNRDMQPKFVCLKETKERSSEKTPFTIITQTASPIKTQI